MDPIPTNIILIGMPASGKSTVGVLLAKKLGYRFVDSDLLIQASEQRLLHDIIQADGIDGFLKIEEAVNCDIAEQGCIIATGGSAVYSEKAMNHLRSIGTVVYLKLEFEEIQQRLGNFSHRGVVMPEGYTLRQLYDERCPLYERYAHVTISVPSSCHMGQTLDAICKRLNLDT